MIDVFFATPIARVRRTVVRYQGLWDGFRCLPLRRHEVRHFIDVADQPIANPRRLGAIGDPAIRELISGIALPERCSAAACPIAGGYAFRASDMLHVLHERMGIRDDTGEELILFDPMHVGLMHRVDYAPAGPDGLSLVVRCPDGELWHLDSISKLGQTWERSGAPPFITTRQTGGPPSRWSLEDGKLLDVDAAAARRGSFPRPRGDHA